MAKVTFLGKEVFTQGHLPEVGQLLADAVVCTSRLEDIRLHELHGPAILNIFPSVDTSVCAKSFKTLCEECKSISCLNLFHLSCDLPFALDRFIKEHKIETGILSCFRSDASEKLGLRLTSGPLRHLCARCLIVIDAEKRVTYVELVPEISHEPNYRAAIENALENL
jgi:thiol peroxidase